MTVPATREEIVSGLAEVLEEVAGTPAENVKPEAAFDNDLDVDSLTMVEVVVACEERFGVRIPDEALESLRTVGDAVVFSNNGTLAGHVQIGDHAIMGGLTAVHQFCRIGPFAITGGCSKIVQDVPPFMIADGNPAEIRGLNLVGLERNGFAPESVKWIKEAFRLIYRSKFNTRQAIDAVRKELPATDEITQLLAFIEQSERGIIR